MFCNPKTTNMLWISNFSEVLFMFHVLQVVSTTQFLSPRYESEVEVFRRDSRCYQDSERATVVQKSESCVKVVPKLWKWGRGLPKSVEVVPKFYQSCLRYESEVDIFRRDSRYYLMWPRFWRTNSTRSTKFANSHKVVNIWSKSCVKVVQKFYQSCFRYESEVEVFRRCSQYDYWLRIWREQHRNNNQVLCKRENFEYIWVYICQELP